MVFLGLHLDSVQQCSSVPADKKAEIKSIIGTLLPQETVNRHQLQSLVGKFSFVASVLPGARPFFRHLVDATKGLRSRWSTTRVTSDMRADLHAWKSWLTHWNGRTKWVRDQPVCIHHDASKSGFGFAISHLPPGMTANSLPETLRPGQGFSGSFSTEHVARVTYSIQYAELFAIAVSVALYGPYLANRALTVYTDNVTDVHIINRKSTRAPDLLPLLKAIYATCANYNIDLRALHVPGVDNVLADYLSRPLLHEYKTSVPDHIAYATCASFVCSSGLRLPPPGTLEPATFSTGW